MVDSEPRFVEIDGNPTPKGLSGGWLRRPDGKRLRYAIVRPSRPDRGTVLVLQGRNETIEKYFETIGDLTRRGYCVAIFDWRGQGGSDRTLRDASKGHVRRIDTYVDDLLAFIEAVLTRECRPPYVALAHSMGGLVALAAIPQLVPRIERLVLSAPLVAMAERAPGQGLVPGLVRILCWLGMSRLAVRRVTRSGAGQDLSRNPLTSDPDRSRRNGALVAAAPELFVTRLTAGWLNATYREMRRLDDSDVIAGLSLPTLFVTAGADTVVSSAKAERLAWRMRSGHFLSLAGARHELLQEADEHRELFLAAFEGFVGSLMPAPTSREQARQGLQDEDVVIAAAAAEIEASFGPAANAPSATATPAPTAISG